MRKKLAKRKTEIPVTTKNVVGIALSTLIGLFAAIMLTVLSSLMLTKSASLSNSAGVYFISCVMIGALITGFIASKKCGFKGIISGVISSIPYSLGITVIMLIFSQGKLDPKTLFLYLGILVCSTFSGIISANTKRRK